MDLTKAEEHFIMKHLVIFVLLTKYYSIRVIKSKSVT